MAEQSYNADTNPGAQNKDREDGDEVTTMLDEARKRYQLCQDADGDNKVAALNDLNFLSGGDAQWEVKAVQQRRLDGRPVITVNMLPTYLHQVTNDQRQNTPSIRVHPVGDRADVETAKILQGIIRHIEYDSNADVCYDTAVNSSAAVGFGYFRLLTTYESETSFNQKIVFDRIRNPLSVKIDPLAKQADGSDMMYCFVEFPMARSEFERRWPDSNACSRSYLSDGSSGYAGWLTDSTVLVCDYYSIEEEEEEVVLLSNGASCFKSDCPELPPDVKITKTRTGMRRKVMLRKITACDELEATEIKCKWIPVFPVYGDEIDIEGKVIRSGIVRHAMGPCQSYNVFWSGATEEVALRTKNPFIGAAGQFEGFEDEWNQANNRAFPFLEYNPVTSDGKLAPPPQRQPMTDVPTGFLAMAMQSKENVMATTGLFQASIGQKGTATSGRQELAQQREGDVANYHYFDGLIRTIRHTGRCIVCMVPHYLDTERVVTIMREDDTMEEATINKPAVVQEQGPSGEMVEVQKVLNDMTCGEFSITVSSGPSYTTMRQESAEFFTNAMQAAKDPVTAQVITYLAMKNQDVPGAEVATKMIASMLPPGPKAVLDEENGDSKTPVPMVDTPEGPVPAAQASQMIAQLMQAAGQMQEQLQKTDAAKSQADAMKAQKELNEQQLEPQRQVVEMKRLEADVAKANAAQAQANASLEQAKVDMVRAEAEAKCAPMKVEAETHTARANAMKAENELRQPIVMPTDPEQEKIAQAERDEKALAKIAQSVIDARPKGADLVIKAPSGMTYDVKATLH